MSGGSTSNRNLTIRLRKTIVDIPTRIDFSETDGTVRDFYRTGDV